MKRSTIITLLLTILNICTSADAASYTNQDHNFAIDIPPLWKTIDPPAPPVILAIQNPDQQMTVLVAAAKVPPNEAVTSSRDSFEGIKAGMSNSGWKILSERDVSINGLIFHSLTAEGAESKNALAFTTSAGSEMYMIQVYSNSVNAHTDSEIQSIINSFRQISVQPANESAAFRIGHFVGRNFLFLALLSLCLAGAVWFFFRKLRRRSKRRY
jgi:hypothetical protein